MFAGHVLTKVLISLIWALMLKISFAPLFLSLLLALLVIAILGSWTIYMFFAGLRFC